MSTILIAGGTGLVGSRLTQMLREQGHTVRLLTRTPKGDNQFAWNPESGTIDDQAVIGTDAVINLAGTGIADGRWTPERRKSIIDSRVQGARVLCDAFKRTGHRPGCYLSASAIGYYGNSGEQIMTETDLPVTKNFTSETCIVWEHAADEVAALGIRTIKLRIGVVLAREGGALAEIIKPIRFGIGGYFGDGQAWYSWIHREDLCRMMVWAIENTQIEGVYNAVAPLPERNKPLTIIAARAMGKKPIYLPAPPFILRVVLGDMADVILNSNRISAQKVLRDGFNFKFPDLESALKDILSTHVV